METRPPLPCLLTMAPRTGAAVASPIITTGSDAQLPPLEEELQNKSMCPTPQGWILVLDRDAAAAACLLDPHSRRRIPLPPLAIDPQLLPYCTCLLHPGDPSDPAGCLVLLVDPIATFLWHCRAGGGSEWTKQEYDIGTQGDAHFVEKRMIAPIAPCGGKFYFNPKPTETAVLELSHGGPAPSPPAFSSYDAEVPDKVHRAKVFLLECEASSSSSLYMVKVLHSGGAYDETKVYRMDFPGRRWCPVDDLGGGGRAFFVGPMNFGASCAAGGGIQENCVYSLVAADDNSFRVFNLKDGTSELRTLDGHTLQTAESTISFWVLPTHQQLK